MADVKYHQLMLVGDSMIEFFDWQRRFPEHDVKNLGRAGESVEELRERASFIVDRHGAPDLVLVMIGTNNVAMENFNFMAAYQNILATFKGAYPEAILLVNSLLPMALDYLAPDTVARVNSSLRSLAGSAGAVYLDVWSAMVDKTGRVMADILADEVHLSAEGYRIWSAELATFLDS